MADDQNLWRSDFFLRLLRNFHGLKFFLAADPERHFEMKILFVKMPNSVIKKAFYVPQEIWKKKIKPCLLPRVPFSVHSYVHLAFLYDPMINLF